MSDLEKEKEIVLYQAQLYIKGMSLREIAEEYNCSAQTIKYNLEVKLPRYSENLADFVKILMQKRASKSCLDKEIVSRVLNEYKLLLRGYTISEIAAELKISEHTVQLDFSKKMAIINQEYPKIITEEMIQRVGTILRQNSLRNINQVTEAYHFFSTNFPSIDRFYQNLFRVALTFGLNTLSLSNILGIDQETLLTNLKKYNDMDVFERYLAFKSRIQNVAISEFEIWFNSLKQAVKDNDKNLVNLCLEEIGDRKVKEFRQNYKIGDPISNEDILAILKYQLKYSLSTLGVCKMFGINRGNYSSRVKLLLDTEASSLKADYENLIAATRESSTSRK